MKTRIILGIVLLATIFTGCKDEKSVDNLEVVKPEAVDMQFKVVIDFIAKTDDTFALYYSTDGGIDFTHIPPVWQGFKGSDVVQQMTFYVPDEIIPTQIRVDFGLKEEQPDIILKKMDLQYAGKSFTMEGANIFKYFQADLTRCTVDPATGTIKAKVENGKRLMPSIYPDPAVLGVEIEKLTK